MRTVDDSRTRRVVDHDACLIVDSWSLERALYLLNLCFNFAYPECEPARRLARHVPPFGGNEVQAGAVVPVV